MAEESALEWRIADVSDRLRRLDPVMDVEWRKTCQDAVALLRDVSRETARLRKHATCDTVSQIRNGR